MSWKAITLALIAAFAMPLCQAGEHAADLPADLPELDALASLPVYGASRHYARQVDAPASVTIITADDIRSFGYRTLGDVLRSVRGVHIYNDRSYDLLSVRGYARAGDYNAGLSLQIDGMRINDPIYDGGLLGSEFPLDVELIERVEFIRGPGSAEFGGNALFGVINVVTKPAASLGGAQGGIEAGSDRRFGASARFGRRFANGASLLLSASYLDVSGETLKFEPDQAAGFAGGRVRDADYAYARRAFAKFEFGDLSLSAGFGTRRKGGPLPYDAPYFFGATNSWDRDSEGFVNLRYTRHLSEATRVGLRAYYGAYDYLGYWPIDEGSGRIEHNPTRANWAGAEVQIESSLSEDLRLVSGLEHQRDMRLYQADFVEPGHELAYRTNWRASRTSAYMQAYYDFQPRMTLTAGLRADRTTASGTRLNPRVGLIFKPTSATAWKLLYGGSERNASAYERLLASEGDDLEPERVRNAELTLEHYFAARTRGVVSLYAFRVDDVIRVVDIADTGAAFYANTGATRGRGAEFEIEHIAAGGTHWRASAAYSVVRVETLDRARNAPRWLVKGNVSQPLPWHRLRVGVEGQWNGAQYSYLGRVSSVALVNMSLSRAMSADGWEFGASVYNVFDRHYDDPLPADIGMLTNGVVPQGGRKFRVTLTRRF